MTRNAGENSGTMTWDQTQVPMWNEAETTDRLSAFVGIVVGVLTALAANLMLH